MKTCKHYKEGHVLGYISNCTAKKCPYPNTEILDGFYFEGVQVCKTQGRLEEISKAPETKIA